jgi:hypothetical protein
MAVSIDYIPKIQARKIFTYAKEQLDVLKKRRGFKCHGYGRSCS